MIIFILFCIISPAKVTQDIITRTHLPHSSLIQEKKHGENIPENIQEPDEKYEISEIFPLKTYSQKESERKNKESTRFKEQLMSSHGQNRTNQIPAIDHQSKKENNVDTDQGETRKTWEPNPVVFIVGLLIGFMSNLFSYMVRVYKQSLPEFNLNMIILLNYYCVEFLNIIVWFQVKSAYDQALNKRFCQYQIEDMGFKLLKFNPVS